MIVVDTGVLVAYVNDADPRYDEASQVFAEQPEAVTSPLVMAEFDYLIRARVGGAAARTAVRAVLGGGLQLADVDDDDLLAAVDVDERYADLGAGLTDASLIVLAMRFDTLDIATFDHRHFRAITNSRGRAYRLLPADL